MPERDDSVHRTVPVSRQRQHLRVVGDDEAPPKKQLPNAEYNRYWLRLDVAARELGSAASALRRAIERRAQLDADGVLEAVFDGVHARKLGGRWRVRLGTGWIEEKNKPTRGSSSSRPSHATRPEKE